MKQRFSVDWWKRPIMVRTRIPVDRWGPPVCGACYQRRDAFVLDHLHGRRDVTRQFGNIRSLRCPCSSWLLHRAFRQFSPHALFGTLFATFVELILNLSMKLVCCQRNSLHMCSAKSRPRIFPCKGGFPLSCNFSVRTHVNFTLVNTIGSTFTFTRDLSYIVSILFTRVKFTCLRT